MRIIGTIPHPILKITVFKNEGRVSLKMETALNEIIYKFRPNEFPETFEEVQQLMDNDFIAHSATALQLLHSTKSNALNKVASDDFSDFQTII